MTEIEAIAKWVRDAAGLAVGQVLWTQQGASRPSGCYVALTVSGEQDYGQPWSEITEAAEPAPMADLEFKYTGPAIATLTLECFAAGDAWVDARPEKRLAQVVRARRLPSVASMLRKAGVGFGVVGAVQVIAVDRSTIFESRALVTVSLHSIASASEFGTWIQKIVTQGTAKNVADELAFPPQTIELPEP